MEPNSVVAVILAVLLVSSCGLTDFGGGGASVTHITDRSGTVTDNGGTTDQRVQTVAGRVMNPAGADASTFDGSVFVVHNGNRQQVTPTPCTLGDCQPGEWEFTTDLVLNSGSNNIQVVVEDSGGSQAGSSSTFNVNANIPARDITATLTWDTNGNDVDMHVYDPQGNHAYYSSKQGIPSADLDLDDIDGYGPETFTMQDAIPGDYTIKVRYYDAKGVTSNVPVTVRLSLNEGTPQVFTHTFTAEQANYDDATNDWTVTTFTMP
ncbi:DUF2135 domain-containing protein [Candidatus Micrarchaeota archaeon]|nr:DUF2135 domain-containing protein [Candidatus Micrarchaeota archaeon]